MNEEKRIGRQTPTKYVVLPYNVTDGEAVVKEYEKSGKVALEWEKLLIYDIFAKNDDDLFMHSIFGYSVPRRNGKNEIIVMCEQYGLTQGLKTLHTAHRVTTSTSAFERLLANLNNSGYVEKVDFKVNRQKGLETIEFIKTGGKVFFRTRTSQGGLGEGFDILVIDEAQEYTRDQETALKYVVSDAINPLTVMCGTPPTAVSVGTVFTSYRKDCLEGALDEAGWAEWSVDKMTDPQDVEAWYEANPSLGFHLTERKIRAETRGGEETEMDFNIQRLGLWVKYNQKSALSENDWRSCEINYTPKIKGKLFLGVKFGIDNLNVSLSVAVKTKDEKIYVEAIDCRPIAEGNTWILDFIKKTDVRAVVLDGKAGAKKFVEDMKDEGLKKPHEARVDEVIDANSRFTNAIYQDTLIHIDQPAVFDVVTNTEKRKIGSRGGFGYSCTKQGCDVSLLDSMILAHWACSTTKEEQQKRRVSY